MAYNLAQLDLGDDKINNASSLALPALLEVSSTLDNLSKLLDYVIVTGVLTQSELDTLKTTINTERTTIDSSINTVQGAIQDLADARLNYKTQI